FFLLPFFPFFSTLLFFIISFSYLFSSSFFFFLSDTATPDIYTPAIPRRQRQMCIRDRHIVYKNKYFKNVCFSRALQPEKAGRYLPATKIPS
ncbi:hypothetical protein, partial [Escherichia coli]|uniref:hypothetical protein n=1 Tax=Escherichia coli TaxID=562 RepID=UPI001BC86C50